MADKKSGGLVPLCNGTVITWTMPPLISGFLVTSSITGSILQLINIVLDVLIYMPFMSALNKRQLMEENKAKLGRKRSMDNIDLFFCNSFCRNVSEC